MINYNTLVITRTGLFGDHKKIGGMETYCITFINEMSATMPVTVIDSSGTYQAEKGIYTKIKAGSWGKNPYFLTISVGFKAVFKLLKNSDFTVYSFGYSGVILSLAKTFGLFRRTKLIVALFGLESVDYSKSSKTFLVKIQYLLGIRGFLGANILKRCDAYLTEYKNHHMDYIKKYPFLSDKTYFCLPDPIEVPDAAFIDRSITARWEELQHTKRLKFISIGRDSPSKRRELSIDLFTTIRVALGEIGYDCSFTICVPEVSETLTVSCDACDGVRIVEGASNSELNDLRAAAHFCISTSDQKVPLLAVLEDMSQGIIAISNDDLGGSLSHQSSILVTADEMSWVQSLTSIISEKEKYYEKSKSAYISSGEFSSNKFRALLESMVWRLSD